MARTVKGKHSVHIDHQAAANPEHVAAFVNGGGIPADVTKTLAHGLALSTADQAHLSVHLEGMSPWPLGGYSWAPNGVDPANKVDVTLGDAVPGTTNVAFLFVNRFSTTR